MVKLHLLFIYFTCKLQEKKRGGTYDQSDEQVLYMNNERLSVPEILFNPMDVGMNITFTLIPIRTYMSLLTSFINLQE